MGVIMMHCSVSTVYFDIESQNWRLRTWYDINLVWNLSLDLIVNIYYEILQDSSWGLIHQINHQNFKIQTN